MRYFFAAVSACLFGWVLNAQDVTVTVDAAQIKGPVRDLVFGHNFEAGDSRGLFSLPATAPAPRSFEVAYAQGYWDPVNNRPAPGVVEVMKQFPFGALRYPGGCLAHNFRWKETVGQLSERGSSNWSFGLDEYLQLCAALKCEPQIIVTDYGMDASLIPQDAADLVEYLNMPAEPKYPWAMKRAANGHKAPYGVKYFEIGNESSHGNHANRPFRRYTEEEYANYFNATVKAMKAIDPAVQTGYVLDDPKSAWNQYVVKHCSTLADFAIVHSYYPKVDAMTPEAAFLAVMSGGPQFDHMLAAYRQEIREGSGRDLPIGLTEFNMSSIAGKPDAMRFSFLAGMQNSETWCKLIDPEQNILMANYWFILNAMYGVVVTIPDSAAIAKDYDGKLVAYKAAARLFMTLKNYTGDEVVSCRVGNAPKFEAPAAPGILASRGDQLDAAGGQPMAAPVEKYDFSRFEAFRDNLKISGSNEAGDLTVEIKDFGKEAYPVFAFVRRPADIPAGAAWNAVVSFEARFVPDADNAGTATLGLGLMDARGWDATRCAAAAYGINKSPEWTKFTQPLQMLGDSERLALLVRFQHMNGKLSGKLELRNLNVVASQAGQFPAYPGVSAYATKSADGKKLYVIAFNRSYTQTLPVKFKLQNFKAASVNIDELYQDNVATVKDFAAVRKQEKVAGNAFTYSLLPHSMTAFMFE